jgi:NADPH:quinone reductase-like Zn-dependent oxidoreductase
MRALVKIADPPYVEFGEAPDPDPLPNEALVEVKAFSLNRGEVRGLRRLRDGEVPGWDVAGVVRQTAPDGSGPGEGARVAGLAAAGAWAELAAAQTSQLAELPDGVSFEQASTLPTAGLTALRTLAKGGLLLGKRVLITGASGGVGRIAVQLAAKSRAHVTGVVGSAERAQGVEELGAEQVIERFDPDGDPFDLILESVGGDSLAAALSRAAPRSTIVAFGNSSGEPTTFDVSSWYGTAEGGRVYAFMIFEELRREPAPKDLRKLAELVANGDLDTPIGYLASWRDTAEALERLIGRKVAGKAVLIVD